MVEFVGEGERGKGEGEEVNKRYVLTDTSCTPPTPYSPFPTPSYISALGLDVGSKRIGIAGCDRTGLIATGLTTIERTRFERDVEQIKQLIDEREVSVLVIGLPYSMDGSLGFQAKQLPKFSNYPSSILMSV